MAQVQMASMPAAARRCAPARNTCVRSTTAGRCFVDGERVADVSRHPAFREAARSVARLYDIAAAPENRELMTFTSPKTGAAGAARLPDPADPCRPARAAAVLARNGRRRPSA